MRRQGPSDRRLCGQVTVQRPRPWPPSLVSVSSAELACAPRGYDLAPLSDARHARPLRFDFTPVGARGRSHLGTCALPYRVLSCNALTGARLREDGFRRRCCLRACAPRSVLERGAQLSSTLVKCSEASDAVLQTYLRQSSSRLAVRCACARRASSGPDCAVASGC